MNERKQRNHAIIIGGSIGGMVTAAYLSKYFKRITIIESDDVLNDKLMQSTPEQLLDYRCLLENASSLGRTGVGQILQFHVIETEAYNILFNCYPELKDKLINVYGARICSLKHEMKFVVNEALLSQDLTEDFDWIGIDRFTLETVLRRELGLQFNDTNQIEWKCNSRVSQLLVDAESNTVLGVKYRSKNVDESQFELYGDFIVDCTGRLSSSTKWLKESLNLIVPTEQIHFGLGYVTFIGERFKTGRPELDSAHLIGDATYTPHHNKAFGTSAVRQIKTMDENSLGTLSNVLIYCINSEYPPNDSYDSVLEWAKEYLHPDYYLILKSTKPAGPLVPYRRAINDRKYVEKLGKKWPRNYILLGDAMCAFNPQYGQGIAHTCRQARLLGQIFEQNRCRLSDISHVYNRRASAISEECWMISTTNDWATPNLKVVKTDSSGVIRTYQRGGEKVHPSPKVPLLIKFLQWYNYWFFQCASKSGELATDFIHVMNQEKGPFLLMKPKAILKVIYASLLHNYSKS
ncbi:unnamed protein product [Didymodactylos carnosus]|uniref:Uncharacterized protein n=1 Tax=Didymodactylos carnosus TaxID=1234261 RepID=A0A814F019_9BILA|nr:unnamed protein product [Didymodactylos carnosus]CAF3749076.1 unnamed protein product [Didymodactylos carnosus]